MKLGQVFDPRHNALNAWRLALAAEVILWHSFPLTGRNITFAPAHQRLHIRVSDSATTDHLWACQLSPFLFPLSTLATLPPAALSWFLIEKHAMSLKCSLRPKDVSPAGADDDRQTIGSDGCLRSWLKSSCPR